MVLTKVCGAIKNSAVSLWCEAIFVCITAYTCYTLKSEIKEFGLKTCFLQEWHKEGTETAVYVERNLALESEFREGADVVNNSVGKVGRGADEEDGIAVYETGY